MLDLERSSSANSVTRRGLLAAAGVGLGALVFGAFGASRLARGSRKLVLLPSSSSTVAGTLRQFVSRPDLQPPAATVTGASLSPGYLFIGPSAGAGQAGPLMLDDQGEPVWFSPLPSALWLTNFRRSEYRGRPVLTWWEGQMTLQGFGRGEGVIADESYRELARVRAGNGRQMDAHEFLLTPRGTALFFCYPESVQADFSAQGGPRNVTIQESVLQEVDVKSGRVLLEWRSLDHIPTEESYQPPANLFDYIHLNSIGITTDENLLVSARCTWAVYKLDRRTGSVIWRLGGKRSDFQLGPEARFAWQHDARELTPSTITVFDDGDALFDDGSGMSTVEQQSRGIVLDVDEKNRQARLVRSYQHPHPILANAMGSFQTLDNGHVLLGWGSQATASEFAPDGKLLGDITLNNKHDSYRAYRFPWTGKPTDLPAVVPRRTGQPGTVTLYVSWNGATRVSYWLVHVGSRPNALVPFGIAARRGFETVIPMGDAEGYVRVSALDASWRRLATSEAVSL